MVAHRDSWHATSQLQKTAKGKPFDTKLLAQRLRSSRRNLWGVANELHLVKGLPECLAIVCSRLPISKFEVWENSDISTKIYYTQTKLINMVAKAQLDDHFISCLVAELDICNVMPLEVVSAKSTRPATST